MWVKICGIRDEETARWIADLRPDAIGLNFYEPSVRSIAPAVAARIARGLPMEIEAVGLFVNHSLDDLLHRVEDCGIGTVQLHGDEPPEFLKEILDRRPDLKIIRAFRVGRKGCGALGKYLADCQRLEVCLAGCLVDAQVSGAYGGTGHTAPWDLLAEDYDSDRWPRLIVAGGLTPDNVSEAIRITAPFGVDVASGVESAPGIKDLALVRRFLEAARTSPAP